MGWAKFDDRYSEHPKVVAAGPLAELLDRRAIEYSARQETDGFVPEQQARRLCADLVMDLGADWGQIVETLVEVGRWVAAPGGYQIHDFLDYNPSKAHRDAERQAARERMAAARANRRGRSSDVRPNTSRSSGSPVPGPQPVPQEPTPPSPPADAVGDGEDRHAEADQQFDEHFWPAYPARNGTKVGKADAKDKWRQLTVDERRRALRGARNLALSDQLPKDAKRFLTKSRAGAWPFDDWQEPATPTARGRPAHAASDPGNDHRHDPAFWTRRKPA